MNANDNVISADNVNCKVALNKTTGNTFINMVNGQIESDIVLPPNGTITIKIVNGAIKLGVPQNTSAKFNANVINGSVNVTNLVFQNEVHTPVSFQGTLGTGEGTISLTIINGNISVTGLK